MKQTLTFAVLSSAMALVSCPAAVRFEPTQEPGSGSPMMHYGGGLLWPILAIAAAVAIYLIVKARRGGSGRETPLEILNKRYAKGEITEEEFDRMKRHLSE